MSLAMAEMVEFASNGSTARGYLARPASGSGPGVLVVLGPLLVFTPQLAQAKRTGNLEYGILAGHYVRGFDAKWLRSGASAGDNFLGSADIQSLADLSNVVGVVRSMRTAPITKEAIMSLVAATLAPVAPLALTVMPLEELLKKLVVTLF